MTWARNIFIVAVVFLMGRNSVTSGWYRFAVQQLAALIIVAVLVTGWFLVTYLERRVKGKPDVAVKITDHGGNVAQVPIKFCPKCAVRLGVGSFQHIQSCRGTAA